VSNSKSHTKLSIAAHSLFEVPPGVQKLNQWAEILVLGIIISIHHEMILELPLLVSC